MALSSWALPCGRGCCAKVVGESARAAADAAAIMNLRIMDFLPVRYPPPPPCAERFAYSGRERQSSLLRCDAFNGRDSKRGIFIADGLRVLATWRIPPCLRLVHVFEVKQDDAVMRLRSHKRRRLSPSHDEFGARVFDCFRGNW